MRVWTIQKPEAYADLIKNGYYRTNSAYIEESKKRAYDWYAHQLENRICPKPADTDYPVWAWHKKDNLQKKPDFRMSGYAPEGTELVCLELEVPNDLILLSDYDDWTFVLNDLYLHDTVRENDWDIENEMLESLSEDELKRAKEISWEKIFDIRQTYTIKACRGINVQAAFWEIKREYIRNTWFFKAK